MFKKIKFIILLVAVLLVVLFLFGYNKNRWSLFIYPNGNLAEESIKAIDSYKSFEDCKKGFEFSKNAMPKSTFECGYKCKIQDKEIDLYICKETKD